jgi:hypothetical protein
VVVRGGSVRGGSTAAVIVRQGAKVVAEGVTVEARPATGQARSSSAARALDSGSTVVLRRCELRVPPLPVPAGCHQHVSVLVEEGARGTAADCACGGPVLVEGQGSSLLHSNLAFPPGMERTVVPRLGGMARELPAAAGAAAGPRPAG